MRSINSLRTEFILIYEEMMELKGLPTVFGTVMANLILSPKELSHEEISEITGYSVSSISRTLNQLIRMGFVYKRKDISQRKFLYQIKGGFPQVMADSYEIKLREFTSQKEALRSISEKIDLLDTEQGTDETRSFKNRLDEMQRTLDVLLNLVKNCIVELKKIDTA